MSKVGLYLGVEDGYQDRCGQCGRRGRGRIIDSLGIIILQEAPHPRKCTTRIAWVIETMNCSNKIAELYLLALDFKKYVS
ncbi:hypothetical protein VNO77_00631 [Canavalia gladiata]|uniref:Uncharacterized protein n=1 Tax=Canavalia gladiata TaxID=3824 RepID=A0AAN9MUJ8_CANGL